MWQNYQQVIIVVITELDIWGGVFWLLSSSSEESSLMEDVRGHDAEVLGLY